MQEGEYIEVFLLPICGLYNALLVRGPFASPLLTSRNMYVTKLRLMTLHCPSTFILKTLLVTSGHFASRNCSVFGKGLAACLSTPLR